MMVDTLTIARELKAADLPAGQAEAIAAAIGRTVAEATATKADLDMVRRDLGADIEVVRRDLGADIEAVRRDLSADIETVRRDLGADIAALRADGVLIRQELHTEAEKLGVEIEKLRADGERIRNQLLAYLISAMVALAGLVIAIIKLG